MLILTFCVCLQSTPQSNSFLLVLFFVGELKGLWVTCVESLFLGKLHGRRLKFRTGYKKVPCVIVNICFLQKIWRQRLILGASHHLGVWAKAGSAAFGHQASMGSPHARKLPEVLFLRDPS